MQDDGIGKMPYNKSKFKEMEVVTEAKKLEYHTLVITSNEKRYPKKYRFSIVNRMQDYAMNIIGDLMEANDISLNDLIDRQMRLRLQRSALRNCRLLLHYIEVSYRLQFIDSGSFEHWAKIANSVRNMIAAWYLSDKNRLSGGNGPSENQGGKP
jgi:hypothetical protein